MKYIELKTDDGHDVLIFIDKITHIEDYKKQGKVFIFFTSDEAVATLTPYKEVKDMIAACYGGEDEED